MKSHPNTLRLIAGCLLTVCCFTLTPARAGDWSSDRLESLQEIFRAADRDRNNNLNMEERDALRAAFVARPDLQILDLNGNRKLDREELDYLEKDRVKKPKKDAREKKLEKERKKKKNRSRAAKP